jgi:hypothetical protein
MRSMQNSRCLIAGTLAAACPQAMPTKETVEVVLRLDWVPMRRDKTPDIASMCSIAKKEVAEICRPVK